MPREAEPSLNEKQFLLRALRENLRLDGREFDQYRPIELTFGEDYGVADVKLGKTRILARVSAEVTVPYADRPLDGIFTIATELGPMASPAFEPNRPTEAEVLLSRLLEKTVRRSGALDTESLCLVAGRKCWSVRADVHVLSHDGNLVDPACLAVVAALRHFRKPESAVTGGVLTVFTPAEREPVPLGWLHSPLCVTWSFFTPASGGTVGGGGNRGPTGSGGGGGEEQQEGSVPEEQEVALLDATWAEEQVRVGSCTVGMNRHGEICQIAKLGGAPVNATVLLKCTNLALEKVKDMSALMDAKLAEDAKRRDMGGLMAELSAENSR